MALGPLCLSIFWYYTLWWSRPYPWFDSHAVKACASLALMLIVVAGNEAVVTLLSFPLLIRRLGDLPLRRPLDLDPVVGLPSITRLYLRITIMAALGYAFFLSAALFSSPLRDSFGPPIILVFAWFGCTIVFFFVLSNYNLHTAMKSNKEEQISKLAPILWEATSLLTNDPSDMNVEKVANLQQIDSMYRNLPEWPFSAGPFAALVGVVFSPILTLAIEKLFFQ